MSDRAGTSRGDRISARVAAITRAKLLRLAGAEAYGTQSRALDVAIDRLYRQTFGTDELPEDTDKEAHGNN
jgi:hypothetical protein